MSGDGEQTEARPDETPGAEGVVLPWSEQGEREFKDTFASATIALLLALSAVGFWNALRGEPGAQLGSALFALALTTVAMLSWYGPFGTVGLVASVDSHGLNIRHRGWQLPFRTKRIELSLARFLPAAEIGTVELVTEDKSRRMWTRSMSLNYKGRHLGWTRVTVARETTEAVLIEQLDANLKRPWWLVKCNNCSELVEALELARSSSASRT